MLVQFQNNEMLGNPNRLRNLQQIPYELNTLIYEHLTLIIPNLS